MRILTWNLGSFVWIIYFKFLNSKLIDKIYHNYLQNRNIKAITAQIIEINPDILVLQEFHEEEDISLMISLLNKNYPYHFVMNSWYKTRSILAFSKYEIKNLNPDNSNFYILKSNNFTFMPIHLYSFLKPERRLTEIKNILNKIQESKEEINCILGDTNFWNFTKKHFFLFKKDKLGYKLLTKNFNDATKNIGITCKTFTNLDKIFLSPEIKYKNPTCICKNGKYMDHYPVFIDIE